VSPPEPQTRHGNSGTLDRLASGRDDVKDDNGKIGDLQSAALLLARSWPPPKGRLVAFPPSDAEAAIGAVPGAVAAGKLTVDEGDKLHSPTPRIAVTARIKFS
jgi:hypothetical protein